MEEIIRVKDQYYILATSSLADDRTRVLKQGETFAVFDCRGDIHPVGLGEQGVFHEGTRFLSHLELFFGDKRPLLLNSTVNDQNELLTVDLMNPDISIDGEVHIPRGSLHIFRSKFLSQETCFERLRVANFGLTPVTAILSLAFDADFRDIFEVRGMHRVKRGRKLDAQIDDCCIVLPYEGLDGKIRRTRLTFSPQPEELTESEVRFKVDLAPQQEALFFVTVSCDSKGCEPRLCSYQSDFDKTVSALRQTRKNGCEIETSNEQFNRWLSRSFNDLSMMITETPHGPYPYAGVPWFSTAFGRDGIITALEMLWVNPEIARGVLTYLAATQSTELNPEQDAEPGKIIHETREGEMAALGEIPFGRYYGSVDATPLFVVLAGAYFERTGDFDLIRSIWPNIRKALEWIDTYGDEDRDGFVEYVRHSSTGLVTQGWKDSWDSVFHADGSLAEGPVALCEVQGYVYDAKLRAAQLAELMGEIELAGNLRAEAKTLKDRFHRAFWCEKISSYALALDGENRPCQVLGSNAGHTLFSGITREDYAARVAKTLLAENFFSGWGIRTVAAGEARYNPMSYHNGSIWPHDNALIAQGLARYGYTADAMRVLEGLFATAQQMDLYRLPELFCGFSKRQRSGPIVYPLACAPQSWAAGSVFLLLQACLGLSVSAEQKQIRFHYPVLPDFIDEMHIRNLQLGKASIDLSFKRYALDVGITVVRREGVVEIVVIK